MANSWIFITNILYTIFTFNFHQIIFNVFGSIFFFFKNTFNKKIIKYNSLNLKLKSPLNNPFLMCLYYPNGYVLSEVRFLSLSFENSPFILFIKLFYINRLFVRPENMYISLNYGFKKDLRVIFNTVYWQTDRLSTMWYICVILICE